ncbi:MAG TPA: PIN domain nuclease [Acidobacteria bacterium]|nr:PIN domain nuclease [Acidobacteriota bacterium]
MKVLFDTNVILDVLLQREPHLAASASLLSRAESGEITCALCATTVTTLYYLTAKAIGAAGATVHLRNLLSLCEVAPVHRPVLEKALDAGFSDFEDAVLHEAACQAASDAIVTRNAQHFKRAVLPVFTPEELLQVLVAQES